MSYSVNEATNQLNGLGYDANGNVTTPPTGGTLTYDFLNRVVAVTGGVEYSYDASNRRVWKLNANGEAYYLYDLNGENLGTFTPQINQDPGPTLYLQPVAWQERAYFFGKKLFVAEDNVGSALASSPSTRSFYPYGEPKSGTAATEQYAFATYWEDSETGLDYAMNRYYSSTLGRFLSPDPYRSNSGGPGDPNDPQSWNRYAYVENDPVKNDDPTGQYLYDCVWSGGCGFGGGGMWNYGGAAGGSSMAQLTGPLATQEGLDEGQYVAFMNTMLTVAVAKPMAEGVVGANGGVNPCAGLLSLPASMSFASLLSQVDITYENLSDPSVFAEELDPTDSDNPDPGHYTVVFNDQVGNPNISGGAGEAANTIIHELIHVAVGMGYGTGALNLGWVNNDGGGGAQGEAAQEKNDEIVQGNCFGNSTSIP
jgi:RHS repeat-associated protein